MTGSLFDQVIEVISQYTITTNYQYQIYHPRSQDQIILVGVILILIILITHIHTYKYKLYNTGTIVKDRNTLLFTYRTICPYNTPIIYKYTNTTMHHI